MTALESYVKTFAVWRGATVPETSYYDQIKALLDDAGAAIKPAIKAIVHLKDSGAGIPDLGLYADHQPTDQKPAHGVVEAKPISTDLLTTANSPQVARYAQHYGQVLVTNYYQFMLVTRGDDGGIVLEERYDLAASEREFWEAADHPRRLAARHGAALREYLLRVMRRGAPLATPQDVAWILASYAREAKARIEASDLHVLEGIRAQLEAALGVRFQDEAADEFFRSTLVQTLFYGVFSAWVLWYEQHRDPARQFDLWNDIREVTLPAIQELFEEMTKPTVVRSLNIREVIEWTAQALNRVDKVAFFQEMGYGEFVTDAATWDSGKNAIQYFYEPFLQAFDPDLRRQLGVWYTPPEVVEYMVSRVDDALRDELGIADGLTDPDVYILDPCCGTGAYLIAVLRRIYQRHKDREGPALAAQAVSDAIQRRVFGFEILPAPFVIAHLQVGILLHQYGAPLASDHRASIYLTNALTGWEERPKTEIIFSELRKERDAAQQVKQKQPILVILGNPPYSGFAGVAIEEERELSTAYRTTNNAPPPQGQGLNDLYVRFFRMAERKIVESTGRGVVCYISNYSWLDGLSHPGMREHYLESFDSITIDCLNGDKYRTGKTTPDGKPDPSIFSTDFNREGIQVGTAVATLVRHSEHGDKPRVLFRHVWGTTKRQQLAAEAREPAAIEYETLDPAVELGYPLIPSVTSAHYFDWSRLPELFPVSFPGVQTKRDEVLVSIEREPLVVRMEQYFDPSVTDEEIRRTSPRLMQDANRFNAKAVREYLMKRGFLPQNIVRYCYRPFDLRWIYWEPETKLLGEKSPDYFPQVQAGNLWIEARQRQTSEMFSRGTFTTVLTDNFGNGFSSYFPLYLYGEPLKAQLSLFEADSVTVDGPRPNLSDAAQAYLASFGDDETLLFYHTLAVMHAPAYRVENAGALRQDWPRVPLPADGALLAASAALGRQVAALLDVESPVAGVTQGDPRADLHGIAALDTATVSPDFNVTAGWGYSGQGGAVMPGRGKVTTHDDGSLDVHLNDTTCWRNIPAPVWAYTLGGYQVLKKWLSYRESKVLGRALKAEEAREFMHIARRIAALLALNETLDENYRAVTADTARLESF